MSKIKIVFMGTSSFAVPILKSLLENNYPPVAVFTKPDRPKNRGLKNKKSPVKEFMEQLKEKIKLFEVVNFKEEKDQETFRKIKPDLLIVASLGIMLPEKLLNIPKFGCLNVHPSLLPLYRGPAPISGPILNHDLYTGTTIMNIVLKMDAGDIVAQEKIKLSSKINAITLQDELAKKSAQLLVKILPDYLSGKIILRKQDEKKATYTKIIKKQDGLIDWKEPAKNIEAKIRAFVPWPGTYTFYKNSKRKMKIEIISAEVADSSLKYPPGTVFFDRKKFKKPAVKTGQGILILDRIKPEGKREMDILDFIAGHKDFIGTVLKRSPTAKAMVPN